MIFLYVTSVFAVDLCSVSVSSANVLVMNILRQVCSLVFPVYGMTDGKWETGMLVSTQLRSVLYQY